MKTLRILYAHFADECQGVDIPNGLVRNCGRFCNSVLTLWVDGACTFTNIGTKVETE